MTGLKIRKTQLETYCQKQQHRSKPSLKTTYFVPQQQRYFRLTVGSLSESIPVVTSSL